MKLPSIGDRRAKDMELGVHFARHRVAFRFVVATLSDHLRSIALFLCPATCPLFLFPLSHIAYFRFEIGLILLDAIQCQSKRGVVTKKE